MYICYIFLQIVAIRGTVVIGGNGRFLGCSELEVRVGPGRVGEGAGEEGEAQRRARAQEEDLGKQKLNYHATSCAHRYRYDPITQAPCLEGWLVRIFIIRVIMRALSFH